MGVTKYLLKCFTLEWLLPYDGKTNKFHKDSREIQNNMEKNQVMSNFPLNVVNKFKTGLKIQHFLIYLCIVTIFHERT